MKKIILLFLMGLFVTIGCKDDLVTKPKNLIERDKMVDIIYDLSLLEAQKNQNFGNATSLPKATEFLKKKYKIDSLRFAKSTQYYASDLKDYKKIYEEVKERLSKESTKLNGGKPVKDNLEEGIVK